MYSPTKKVTIVSPKKSDNPSPDKIEAKLQSRQHHPIAQSSYETNLSTNESKIDPSPKPEISDVIYDNFIQMLTINKFKEFSYHCKEKEIDNIKHDMKLKKSQFLQIMKTTFPGYTEFQPLYEILFNRFKVLKAKIVHNQRQDSYFIYNISSEDEIDIYEISCALACFVKCYFFEKLQMLFDLTDVDDDGFISISEVKKMIFTLNYIFSQEENSIGTDSQILSQSLASIKAKKAYAMIMKHPGNLAIVFQQEKYINFKQFLNAVQKVYNYKFGLMPLFISMKRVLKTKRREKEIEINKNTYQEYVKISNDIVSEVKKEGDIGKTNIDFKKNIEVEKKDEIDVRKSKKNVKNKDKDQNKNEVLIINYNKICGLETYPGKYTIKNLSYDEYNHFANSNINKVSRSTSLHKGVPGYMTSKEILDEILILSNKHKLSDDKGEELKKISKEISKRAEATKNKLKEPLPVMNLLSMRFKKEEKNNLLEDKKNKKNDNENF